VAKALLRLIVILAAAELCGCGTLLSEKSAPYSGVCMDARLAGNSLPHPGAMLPVLDLPASFVADTLILPMTLPSSEPRTADRAE
jgi:uncharacterized protein YceK